MFADSSLREHFRYCLVCAIKSSQVFGSSEDSKRVSLFYGRILTKTLFPDGPQNNFEPNFPVSHSSYGPWQAECSRCVAQFFYQVRLVEYFRIIASWTSWTHNLRQDLDTKGCSLFTKKWDFSILYVNWKIREYVIYKCATTFLLVILNNFASKNFIKKLTMGGLEGLKQE